MTITYLVRSPGTGHSIEALFGSIQQETDRQPDIRTERVNLPYISRGWRSVWRNLRFVRTLKSDIFHITGDIHYVALALPGSRAVLTIHDCSTLVKSQGRPIRYTLFWLFWYYLPIRRASVVTAVSEKTRRELIGYVGRIAQKVIVVSNGYDPALRHRPASFQTSHPVLLQVGTAPNKNLVRLITALEGIPCTLLLIGPLTKAIQTELQQRLIDYRQYENLSRAEVAQLYTDCDIVTFISTYEGFGMPVLEANAVGRVVITAIDSPMHDLFSDSAHFVNPLDIAAIRQGIVRLITDTAYRQKLVQAGLLNAQRYTAAKSRCPLPKMLPENSIYSDRITARPMKILLSADCFYPAQMGGPSNTIYWLAKALTRAGHDVTVIATSQDLPPSVPRNQWVPMDCGRVMYTRNPHFYLPLRHIWQGWRAIANADIVHVNSLFYPASLIWVLLGQWAGKPVVWSPHGELNPVALAIRPRLKRVVLGVVKRILGPSVHFQATSQAETGHIKDYFGKAISVTEIQTRMELPPLIQPDETLCLAPPYLLFIGRLHPIKAIDNLIRALGASAIFCASDFSLVIAGAQTDNAYGNVLTELVRQLGLSRKVTFVGLVRGHWKEILYANARLTILPSHAESFGNVVIESLAQGTPVIASTHTPWQQLETEQVGSWVANDPEPLRQAIEKFVLMPPDAYHQYRQRAYKLAHRQFDVHEHVGEWEQLYQKAGQTTNHTKDVVIANS